MIVLKQKITFTPQIYVKIKKMTKSGLHGRSMISLVRLLLRMQIIFREGQSSADPREFKWEILLQQFYCSINSSLPTSTYQ
jgi:hypothetical protein